MNSMNSMNESIITNVIAEMDNTLDHTFESANRIYGTDGVAPTLPTCAGGGIQPKIMTREYRMVASRGRPSEVANTEQHCEMRSDDISSSLTTVQKDTMLLEKECAILTPKRTEYGKAVRKAYESHQIKESRHNMTELEPRTDGIANSLTTVQKDNTVSERYSNKEDGTLVKYRIRKLTERESGRLMGVSNEDISKMAAINSPSQLYKQYGNSICIPVLMGLFSQLNIKGVESWNDRLARGEDFSQKIKDCEQW